MFKKQRNEYKNITRAKKQGGLRSTYRLVKHRVASTYLKKETKLNINIQSTMGCKA
jgi:hypothetical protein